MLFSRIRALLGDSYSTLLKWTQSTNNSVLNEFMNSKIGLCSLRRNYSKLKTMKSDVGSFLVALHVIVVKESLDRGIILRRNPMSSQMLRRL